MRRIAWTCKTKTELSIPFYGLMAIQQQHKSLFDWFTRFYDEKKHLTSVTFSLLSRTDFIFQRNVVWSQFLSIFWFIVVFLIIVDSSDKRNRIVINKIRTKKLFLHFCYILFLLFIFVTAISILSMVNVNNLIINLNCDIERFIKYKKVD